jgi:hypothetical protein
MLVLGHIGQLEKEQRLCPALMRRVSVDDRLSGATFRRENHTSIPSIRPVRDVAASDIT